MKNPFLYVAMLKDYDNEYNVIAVQENKDDIFEYIKCYFGILEDNTFPDGGMYLGYKKIDYCEFEDDLDGYHNLQDKDGTYCVYVYCKYLNEKCT